MAQITPAYKFSGVLKVVQKSPEDVAAGKSRTIATLKMAEYVSSTTCSCVVLQLHHAAQISNPSCQFLGYRVLHWVKSARAST